jgi:hypothetical protein
MNVSRFHVSCIQETDYRPHFTCGGLLEFLGHCKTHRTMRKRDSIVRKWRPCLPKGPTNSARMRTIVTTELQRQYLQTELTLWIRLVYALLQCYMFRPYKTIFRQHFYKESNALRTNQLSFFQLRS